jgi:outer membrane protein assembly factor BamB
VRIESVVMRLGLVIGVACAAEAHGDDWPMWRYDAARCGASPEELPAGLRLKWVRELPTPAPAWPNEPRLHFDIAYRPVVMVKALFVGSPNDGSVTAYSTETGEQAWRFYTEGPVRVAPVAWKGRVFAGSDDGYLYCLDAATGTMLWRFRGAPDDRAELHHLGNARLISYWPVRGAPVLVDGVVYFAAGVWPTMGTFVHALDAETGEPLWTNDRLNYIGQVRIDHNELHDVGLSPQGYLAVAGDRLLVANGRSMPVGLDRHTGELLYHTQGYRHGHWRFSAHGRHVFVGEAGVLNIETGRELGSRYHEAEKKPQGFDSRQRNYFEGPYFDYKSVPATEARSVFVDGKGYGGHKGVFYAHDVAGATVSLVDSPDWGGTWKINHWDAPEVWRYPTRQAQEGLDSTVLVAAGNRLYGHAGRMLTAVEIPAGDEQPRIVWEEPLPGTPAEMLAADGKLFVVTSEGQLLCYGGGGDEAITHGLPVAPLAKRHDAWTETASVILKATAAREGYCVVLGLESGRLVEELLAQSRMKVIAVDEDAVLVNRLRDAFVSAGLCGNRVEVFIGEPLAFALPPYMASLVVSETLTTADVASRASASSVFETLRPYGGVACFGSEKSTVLDAWVSAASLAQAEVAKADGFALLRRVGPLPGSAPWSHETADPARTYFSRDDRVRSPLGVLWYGDGPDHGFWKYKDYGVGVKPQVVGGRLFAFCTNRNLLRAIDVYTGRFLWERKVEHFTRYASLEDGIYVAGGDSVVVYDPATGAETRRLQLDINDPAAQKPAVADIRVGEGTIVVATAATKVRNIQKGLWDSSALTALDRETGRQLWNIKARQRFTNNALVMGDGLVWCMDSLSSAQRGEMQRRATQPETDAFVVQAVDERTGDVRWERAMTVPFYVPNSWLAVRGNDDWLAYSSECGVLLAGKGKRIFSLDAQTGETLWEREATSPQPLILTGQTFFDQQGVAYDIRSSERMTTETPLARRGCRGCNYGVANAHLFFIRDSTACYIDTDTGERHHLRNVRAGCSNSLIAADGVLSIPNFSVACVCNYPVQTAFTMVHMPDAEGWAGREPLPEPLALNQN